jgi:uncharacterized BrkB/YihY/UPF0761 family membrane protein
MVWVYYTAVILYFGAEFTKVYSIKYGSKIRPNKYAVWVTVKEEEKPADKPLEEVKKEEAHEKAVLEKKAEQQDKEAVKAIKAEEASNK